MNGDGAVHTALWITYLSQQFRTPPHQLLGIPKSKDFTVDVLAKSFKPNHPLLGIGLWNLLSAYEDTAAWDGYRKLFTTVYGYGAAQARATRRGNEAPVFPLDPQQIVQEATIDIEETLGT